MTGPRRKRLPTGRLNAGRRSLSNLKTVAETFATVEADAARIEDVLPCGHTSHSPAEEARWASPKFREETARWRALARTLVAKLTASRTNPGQYPPYRHTWEAERLYHVRRHFQMLRARLKRPDYLKQVARYDQALQMFRNGPACRRDASFPLEPSQVPGLTHADALPTPRTGGRSPSLSVADRNQMIHDLRKVGYKPPEIVATLDARHVPLPPGWRSDGVQTWRQAFAQHPKKVRILFAKARHSF